MLCLLLSLLRSGPARAVVGPLRVRYDFSDPSLYVMGDTARDLYQNSILPEAAEYIGRALSVERVEGPLRLARTHRCKCIYVQARSGNWPPDRRLDQYMQDPVAYRRCGNHDPRARAPRGHRRR